MFRKASSYLIGILLSVATFAFETSVSAESNQDLGQPSLDQAIERYLRSHPEVIEEALKSLETQRQEKTKARIRQAIVDHQDELLNDPDSPISGNPSGDVTVVEFFDYRCGYCKRVAPAVMQLQQEDPHVRIVYKDFPILGEVSLLAARAALAAHAQGKHQVFHEALLATERDLSREEVLSIAEKVGLDRKTLEYDMRLSKWDTLIARNRTLAEALSITGTPGFIIGNELYPGALPLETLKQLIMKVRSK